MGKKKIRPEEVTDTPEAIAAEEQPTAGAAASGAPEDIAEPVPEPERVTDGTADADDMASETDEGDEEALEARLEQAETHAAELLESLQRERASFQNYKRRVEAERAGQWQAATGAVLLKMIPVLDDFHRAMDAVPEADRDQWYEGVLMIQRKFERVLADQA